MTELLTLKDTIAQLEWFCEEANQHLYDGVLPAPIITIQTTKAMPRKRQVYGWCSTGKAWSRGQNKQGERYEINIAAEYMNRGLLAVCETMLHELAHLWNAEIRKKRDCSSNQYHNKHFKEAAEGHGLTCEQVDKFGWARTGLKLETEEWIHSLGLKEECFDLARLPGWKPTAGDDDESTEDEKEQNEKDKDQEADGTKGKMKRWACECTNIRCATEVKAVCQSCGKAFVLGAKAEKKGTDEGKPGDEEEAKESTARDQRRQGLVAPGQEDPDDKGFFH